MIIAPLLAFAVMLAVITSNPTMWLGLFSVYVLLPTVAYRTYRRLRHGPQPSTKPPLRARVKAARRSPREIAYALAWALVALFLVGIAGGLLGWLVSKGELDVDGSGTIYYSGLDKGTSYFLMGFLLLGGIAGIAVFASLLMDSRHSSQRSSGRRLR